MITDQRKVGETGMVDRIKLIKGLNYCIHSDARDCPSCPYWDEENLNCVDILHMDALAILKEQEGLLGIQQTADSITFVSTGTAQQGESRGLLLGKLAMHEWLKKELLYRGLLTDDIRAVFDEAKRQESR